MAGPCAIVWLPCALDAAAKASLEADFARISQYITRGDLSIHDTRAIGGGYVGAGRPFVWGPELRASHPEIIAGMELAASFVAIEGLSFGAMMNGQEDHRILAELCIHVAGRFHGMVDLDGDPSPVHSPSALQGDGAFLVEEQPRQWCLQADALRGWLRHPMFRMVK